MKPLLLLVLVPMLAAPSFGAGFSDFYKQWTLVPSRSAASCCKAATGFSLIDGPGVNLQFDCGNYGRTASLSPGKSCVGFCDEEDGQQTVALVGQTIVVSIGKSRVLTYALTADDGLETTSQEHGRPGQKCAYASAHPDLVGKTMTGAELIVAGTKRASCRFQKTPATSVGFTEKCDLGAYGFLTDLNASSWRPQFADYPEASLVLWRKDQALSVETSYALEYTDATRYQDTQVVHQTQSVNPYLEDHADLHSGSVRIQFEYGKLNP